MATFHYQALNSQRQLVIGEVQAESVALALAQLEAEGLVVQSIGYSSAALPASTSRVLPPERSARQTEPVEVTPEGITVEQAALRSHMAGVLERGKALVPALRAFSQELPAGQQRQLAKVLQVLDRGDAVEATAALATLPEYWIPLLSAAAASRDPGRVLSEFLEESQRAASLRRQWLHSIAYPLFVAALAVSLFAVLSIFIIPSFRRMFMEFDLSLPFPTIALLKLARWFENGWIFIAAAAAVVAIVVLLRMGRLLPANWQAWFGDRFGTPLGRATALARFAQFFADLLEAGLETPKALRIAGYTTRSGRLQRAAWRLAKEIERGDGFALSDREPLSYGVLHALRTEMPTSTRVRLLREISLCHADGAGAWLSWTRGMVEPVAIIVIGLVVGGTVFALFMPLISLITGLSGF